MKSCWQAAWLGLNFLRFPGNPRLAAEVAQISLELLAWGGMWEMGLLVLGGEAGIREGRAPMAARMWGLCRPLVEWKKMRH